VEDVPGATAMGEECAPDVRAFAVVGNTSWFVSQLSATAAAAESSSSSRQFNTKQDCLSHNNSSTQSASWQQRLESSQNPQNPVITSSSSSFHNPQTPFCNFFCSRRSGWFTYKQMPLNTACFPGRMQQKYAIFPVSDFCNFLQLDDEPVLFCLSFTMSFSVAGFIAEAYFKLHGEEEDNLSSGASFSGAGTNNI
jgi:hypothetical protein